MYQDYTVIDAHAHIFPDKIAKRATDGISEFYDLPMDHEGSFAQLVESGDKAGVDGYLVCSVATNVAQVQKINSFLHNVCENHRQCFGFAALHPFSPHLEEDMADVLSKPFKGIKLHPDFQEFNIDDPAVYPMYEMIQASGLPILMHMGDGTHDFSAPQRLKTMLKNFPKLRVIAAHLGSYIRWEEACEVLQPSEQLRVDTSSSLAFLNPQRSVELIRHYGSENCYFGVDFPMWDHTEELERFFSLGLTDTENRRILSENFITWIHQKG